MSALRKRCLAILSLLPMLSLANAEDTIEFGRDIRPILSENCFFCHGDDALHREEYHF